MPISEKAMSSESESYRETFVAETQSETMTNSTISDSSDKSLDSNFACPDSPKNGRYMEQKQKDCEAMEKTRNVCPGKATFPPAIGCDADRNVMFQQVPIFDRDSVPPIYWELGIQHGYRKPDSSAVECLRSALVLTNETVNFWTHFVPFWFFAWQAGQFFQQWQQLTGGHSVIPPRGSGMVMGADMKHQRSAFDTGFLNPPGGGALDGSIAREKELYYFWWPFLFYLFTVCCCPLVSSWAHLFNVVSETARHVCFFLDYIAVAWYSFGSALAYQAYSYHGAWGAGSGLLCALLASLACTAMACESRFIVGHRTRKALRVAAFMLPYLTASYPLVLRLLTSWWAGTEPEAVHAHARHLSCSFLMCLFYAMHIPERFAPGKFDLVGHSHQIMHVLSMLSCYEQIWAVYGDLRTAAGSRKSLNTAFINPNLAVDQVFGWMSALWFSAAVFGNLALFAWFTKRLLASGRERDAVVARDPEHLAKNILPCSYANIPAPASAKQISDVSTYSGGSEETDDETELERSGERPNVLVDENLLDGKVVETSHSCDNSSNSDHLTTGYDANGHSERSTNQAIDAADLIDRSTSIVSLTPQPFSHVKFE